MDIEKLIERLRTESLYADKASLEIMDLCMEAATAIETLRAENVKLQYEAERQRRSADDMRHLCENAERAYTKAQADLARVTAERDAVEQDFRAFAKQWWEEDSGFPCRWCKFERQGGCEWKAIHPGEICAGMAFEWRGIKED